MLQSNPRITSRTRSRASRPRVSTTRSRASPTQPRRASLNQHNDTELPETGNVIFRTYNTLADLLETARSMVLNPTLWRSILRSSIFIIVAGNLYATAWGTYVTFYASYIPVISNSSPLYFNYGNETPFATVQAYKNNKPKFFSYGQSYDLYLELEVPESETNLEQGNFMARLELANVEGRNILVSERPGLIKYRSSILRKIMTIFYSIPLVLEMKYEKQHLSILLAENFWEDYDEVIKTITVRLSNPKLQIYSSNIIIKAHLTGLKYFMHYWPTITAAIITSLFFLGELIFALLAWQGVVYMWGRVGATSSSNSNPPPPPSQQFAQTGNPESSSAPTSSMARPASPNSQQPTTEEEEWERLSVTYLSGGAITPPTLRPVGINVLQGSSQSSERVTSVPSSSHDPDLTSNSEQYFGRLTEIDSQTFHPTPIEVSHVTGAGSSLDMDLLTFMTQSRNQNTQRTYGSQLRPVDPDQRSGTLIDLPEETAGSSSQNVAIKDEGSISRFSDSYPTPVSYPGPRLRKKSSKDDL